MNNIEGINFIWTGHGFGNALILAQLTKICNDNGINAVFSEHSTTKGLIDVPLYNKQLHNSYYNHTWKGVRNTYQRKNCDEPTIVQYVKNVEQLVGKKIKMTEEHNHIPVAFEENLKVPSLDVVMNTETGPWAPYRDWSYFDELRRLFDTNNIAYIDLNENQVFGIRCLTYVKNAKLYLGLETGMSHYVSRFANGKALILQSGFCPFVYWSYAYDYDCLKIDVDCERRPCFINKENIAKGIRCDTVDCMKAMTPETVFNAIIERLP